MTARFPRGSEWRKWDLHVHPPGTKLSDGYGPDPWGRFCDALEHSDVAVFGIADYFSFDGFFNCRNEFRARFPHSKKVLFPNLELRLPDVVNRDDQTVDLHLILRPDLTLDTANRLLTTLRTEVTEPGSDRRLSCVDLALHSDYARATVSRESIRRAIEDTFGPAADRSDHVLIVVPANNSGIRALSSQQRRANIADAIDRMADAMFGSDRNTDHFLRSDRYEDTGVSAAKPVFSGCDAHSFEQLETWLGRHVDDADNRKTVTWIKADPTFEGLQQTLHEPSERVRIQPTTPDGKEPYKVISSVRFVGTQDFPERLQLNANLVSIIGSRSSGKSALLAYIAHAIDPGYTEAQQRAADPHRSELGPAAGRTWASVQHIQCVVEWGDPDAQTGRVIYIPQNSLYAISERPHEITQKILPALRRADVTFAEADDRFKASQQSANSAIRDAVETWFRTTAELETARAELRDFGDRRAVEGTRDRLAHQVEELRRASSLTDDEAREYQALVDRLSEISKEAESLEADVRGVDPYLLTDEGSFTAAPTFEVEIRTKPAVGDLPREVRESAQSILDHSTGAVTRQLVEVLGRYRTELTGRIASLRAEAVRLRTENGELIEKNRAVAEIETLLAQKQREDAVLTQIDAQAAVVQGLEGELQGTVGRLEQSLAARAHAGDELRTEFEQQDRRLDPMSFGLEQELSEKLIGALSERFNRRDTGAYVDRVTQRVDIARCQMEPGKFLAALRSDEQKIRAGESKQEVAIDVLTATPEARYFAEIEGDRVGGFASSSMTPGKQALFALTLILNESEDAWPLLIDQPEDDLDSRSIYDVLVRYLAERKRERQIIMVTHNANLVVGADSEQVVVTNRHGVDRQNADDRMFDYFSGSLEHTLERRNSAIVFELGGIREHACDILDGGEDAFRKRREKYKIR